MGSYDKRKIQLSNQLCTVLGILAGISLLIATLFMVANIIARPFGYAFRFIYDLTGLCAAFAAALSIPYCGLKRGHSVMDIVLSRLPHRARNALEAFSGVVGTGTILLVMYGGAKYAVEKTLVFEKTASSGMPIWIFRWVWVLGMALVAFALLLETIDFVRRAMGRTVYTEIPAGEEEPLLGDGQVDGDA